MVKTQNPSVYDSRFEEFTIPALDDLVDGERDELLLYSPRAQTKYLSWMEQHCPNISNLFVSTTKRKKWVAWNTILFWIRSVINQAYTSASKEDCGLVRVKTHKVPKIATSLLVRRNSAIQ